MPYIHITDRDKFDSHIAALSNAIAQASIDNVDVAGNLNYCITRLIMQVLLHKFGRIRYWMSPLMRGVLQDVGDEMYRRVFHEYEDRKIEENGDIPEYAQIERAR